MLNFIARYFSSLWSFITWPFRSLWALIVRIFPPREFTVMDIPLGNVYTFSQSSFWRFTKFFGKIGLILWASWSTYVFVYHRPMLQKRTMQLQQEREYHDRQLIDLQTYMGKFNGLTRELTVIDDKIMNSKKLSEEERETLTNSRVKIWGELEFLKTRISELLTDRDYNPEFLKMADLSVAYDTILAENTQIKTQHEQMLKNMAMISAADNEIVNTVAQLTEQNIKELHQNLNKINSTLSSLGIQEQVLIQNANKYTNPIVNAAFSPITFDSNFDTKYHKLAAGLETWAGLTKLSQILPFGAPVKTPKIIAFILKV